MTLKACCSNIYAILKRHLWLSALWFAMLFFYLPVQTALTLQGMYRYVIEIPLGEMVSQSLVNIFGLPSAVLPWLLMLMAFISAIVYGGYMHKQKQVDFYHSQPLSRTRLLLQNAASGFLALFIPYIFNLLLAIIVVVAMGWGGSLPWAEVFFGILVHTLYYTDIFATALLAVVISGKSTIASVGGVFLLAFLPALLGLALMVIHQFYPVFYDMLYNWELIFRWLSPAAAYALNFQTGLPNGLLPIIIYDALVIGAATLLYRRRGSEAAGQAIAFKAFKAPLKYALTFLVAGLFAYVFHSIGYSDGSHFWWYFGAIAGGFLAAQITEIVYAADFRAVLRNLRGLAIFMVVFLALSVGAIYDVSGFNSAVPRADQVVSAQIYLPFVNNYSRLTYGISYGYTNPVYEEMRNLQLEERDYLAMGLITSPQGVAAAINIAARYANTYLPLEQQQPVVSEEQLNRWQQQGKQYLVDNYLNKDIDQSYYGGGIDLNFTSCRIVYTLKNGRTMARNYTTSMPVQYSLDDLKIIYSEEEFRAAQLRELMRANECYVPERLELFELYYELPPLDWRTAEDRDKLLTALRADMLELTVEEQLQAMPLGALTIRLYGGPVDYPLAEQWSEHMLDRPYRTHKWPIYASFSRTLALLAEKGYGPELFAPQLKDIISVTLVESYYYSYDYNPPSPLLPQAVYDSYSSVITTPKESGRAEITDPARIAELIAASYPAQTREYNCFIDIDTRLELEVNYRGPGGQTYTQWRIFPYILKPEARGQRPEDRG